ncbi:MAG: element excision factor XisI family protein [Saprospiraceae bacterium]
MKNKTKTYSDILAKFCDGFIKDYPDSDENFTTLSITDKEKHHYQCISFGFQDYKNIFSVFFHLDIIEDKIWIQRDITDLVIVDKLQKLGIPKEDIVLGYRHPKSRFLSGFGVSPQGKAA